MELRQVYRILIFGYINCLPSLLIFWILAILPEVIEHNMGVTQLERVSQILSIFEAAYFFGLILAAILWPMGIKYISKRNSLFVSLILQGTFNALTGWAPRIWMIIFFRFATALSSNQNTVGKDFIFEFAKPEYRQYAYSVKNVFSVATQFLGPIIGYYIYETCEFEFTASMYFVSYFYIIGLALYVLAFYIDFREGDIYEQIQITNEEEEQQAINKPEGGLA